MTFMSEVAKYLGKSWHANEHAKMGVAWTPIKFTDIATTQGQAIGEQRQISGGPDDGARIVWSIPADSTNPTWCWWLWPQSAYGV